MDDKQLQIVTVAQQLFEEQGIQQTSVNDIAKECKMSKATFYKYFKSKESIIRDILLLTDRQLLDSVRSLNTERDLNGIEKLIRKIRLFWDHSFSRGIFWAYILEHFSEDERKAIAHTQKALRSEIMEEYKIGLQDAFGSDIEPIMGDLILCMEGIIREFIYLSYAYSSRVEADVVAQYTYTILDAIVQVRGEQPGIIDESLLYNSDKLRQEGNYGANVKQVLMRIHEIIELSTDKEKQEKLLEAVVLITKEFRAKQYRSLMMDALLAFLGKEQGIASHVKELEQLRYELVNLTDHK